MATKNVKAAEVREWAKANGVAIGERGIPNPEVVKAYHKANKGKRYAPKVAEAATITVKVKTLDSLGRVQTRPVTVTTASARELLGHAPKTRGRFSHATLSLALEALALALAGE